MSSTRKKMILGSYVNSSVLPTPPMMRLVLKHRWRTARKNREKNVYHSIRKDFFFFCRLSSDDFFKKSAISCYSNIQKAKTAKKNFFFTKAKVNQHQEFFFFCLLFTSLRKEASTTMFWVWWRENFDLVPSRCWL